MAFNSLENILVVLCLPHLLHYPRARAGPSGGGAAGAYGADEFDEILAQEVACLPKDATGNFITDQEKSDVVHDLLAFLAERMLEMNKQKQAEINGLRKRFTTLLSRRIAVFLPRISSETVLLNRRCWIIFT